MFRWLTALLLMLPLAAFGIENTNSISVTVGAATGHDFDQFNIDISGFDDQEFRFTVSPALPSHTWTFKMARHAITGQVSYVVVADAAITDTSSLGSLMVFDILRTSVPPDGVYLSSLRADDGTLGVDVARGRINVTQSIYDDDDGTFTFPATVAAVDYFKRVGDILIPTDTVPTGQEGYIYWDDSEATIKAHDGTGWKAVGLAGATDHGALTGRGDDDHSAYGSLAGVETIAGNWVNTENPWADNEVADALTITGYMQDGDINTFAELQSWVSDKVLINEADAATLTTPSIVTSLTVTDDDWIGLGASAARIEYDDTTIDLVEILGANVRVGAVTPDTATAASDLAVFGTIEAQGSGGMISFSEAGTPTFTLDRDGSDTWSMRNVSGVYHIYNSTDAGSRLSIDAGDGDVTIVNDLEVDLIREKTGDAGVTIDSVVLKDNIVDATVVKGAPQNWAWMYRNAGLTHETDGGYEELDWDTVLEDASSIVDLTDNDWSYTYTGIATLTCYIELSATLQNSTQYMALKINDVTGSRRIFAKRKMLGNVSHALNGTIQFRVDDVARTYKLEYWQNDSTSEAYVVGSNKCYCTTYILPD
jgi:hypothetical protein